jgi:hypothetical protein
MQQWQIDQHSAEAAAQKQQTAVEKAALLERLGITETEAKLYSFIAQFIKIVL